MDIDEFLDRELSDFGISKQKSQGIDDSQLKEGIAKSEIFDSVQSSIEKGNITDAESSYSQLWHVLAQENFKWDQQTYEKILSLSRQISQMLLQAGQDISAKSQQITDLISKSRVFLKEGKKDEALRTYNQAHELSESIPKSFFEERKNTHEQLAAFYQELKTSNENQITAKVESLISEIRLLASRSVQFFRKSDIPNSAMEYSNAVKLYNQIPDGFLNQKAPLGMQLLEIYKSLSIYHEIQHLQKQLGMPVRQAQFPMASQIINKPNRDNAAKPAGVFNPNTVSERKLQMKTFEDKSSASGPGIAIPKAEIMLASNSGQEFLKQPKSQSLTSNQKTRGRELLHHGRLKPGTLQPNEPAENKTENSPLAKTWHAAEAKNGANSGQALPKANSATMQQSRAHRQNPLISKFVEEEKNAEQEISSHGFLENTSEQKQSDMLASAKKNFERGFYNEAEKDIEEAIKASPKNPEAKALMAKIKAWQ